jgi:hypothetical protein
VGAPLFEEGENLSSISCQLMTGSDFAVIIRSIIRPVEAFPK